VATQFRDMPLGGTSGFASQYTPIRFAPLVSLTGPIAARPQPAAAPEEQMMRPQMPLMDQSEFGTGDEAQGLPYYGGPPIGERSNAEHQKDAINAFGFLSNPIGTLLNYAATRQSPYETLQALVGGSRGQTPSGAQGGGFGFQNPFAGLSNWFSGKVFGPEEVSLSRSRSPAPVETAVPVSADIIDMAAALGITPEHAMAIMNSAPAAAVGPVSTLGMDMFGPAGTGGGQITPGSVDIYGRPVAGVTATPVRSGDVQSSSAYDNTGGTGVTEGFSISDFSGGGQAPY
jgi:hypothetical protein